MISLSGYLNVLVNSHWRSHWCLIKNGQLWFYQDKGKTKVSQQPVPLEGCMVLPDPSPEHLYSFRIQMDGAQLATLEVGRGRGGRQAWGKVGAIDPNLGNCCISYHHKKDPYQ